MRVSSKLISTLVLFVVLISGCAQPQPKRASGKYLTPSELSECKAKGGRSVMARFSLEVCAVPTNDAGKPCNDKSDCEGFCEVWGAEPNTTVTGTCSKEAQDVPTGCFNHVRGGKATGEWCFH